MKKKIIILIILLIIVFFGYKFYLLNKYNVEKRDIDTSTIFKDEININLKGYQGNLFTYQNISFKNDFNDYIKNEHDWYIKRDKDDTVISALYITKTDQYHNLLTDGNLEMFNSDDEKEIVNKFFNEEDRDSFLKESNINNDIDLMNYVKNNYYLKNNLLTCSKTMKQNYMINSFVDISLPTFSKITLIKGDLSGYIFHASEKIRQVHILNGEEQYIISLVGDELISNEYIISLLETIKIN